ncbi:MAG: DEAD/DEAH box helicase family protein [Bacteroidetes bacterium]|jgi:type III restriction enzyme|nr:DEAD/DEAH box helicase family protein [Bacteroidota bacterium]
MSDRFFEQPILNSPYERPDEHWELDENGQPTQNVVESRRRADFVTPIPKPKGRRAEAQQEMTFDEGLGLSTEEQAYDPTSNINALRKRVNEWRNRPDPADWHVTAETARLLQHWRRPDSGGGSSEWRPFFCQREAVETAIWLTEVAPGRKEGEPFLDLLERASSAANPGLSRLALKMATGAGKTMVMAMLIAWQTINAKRHPRSKRFTNGFLVVTPGITIKDRLRVLQPSDPDNYYTERDLVPTDMMDDVQGARIVLTNYHAFKRRERRDLSTGTRKLLQGRGEEIDTLETEGQMLQRVMPELMSMKRVVVLNDEAHHCYRHKPGEDEEESLDTSEKEEAKKNTEAAHLWISGVEALQRKIGVSRVFDLSATPFFLRGSGYAEGTLFPWTMSDFSLMDAIECGIVKLPRVPVADNVPGGEMPRLRELWENLKEAPGTKLPKAGRRKVGRLDPLSLPTLLQTALEALYGHYEKTYEAWEKEGLDVPPCFIVVCQNTSISKLVYEYIAGFERENEDGTTELEKGRLPLFRNHDDYGNALARPKTLLIDSEQLESGDALDKNFREMAEEEIDRYREEIVARTGDQKAAESISDEDLLREVMNTVGKKGRLGEEIRCVVSVSMLTEGWDANNVTHVLGVRAFGTQLLCEQVIGRALRRQSYELNDEGLFEPEYADVLGIPFDFTAEPVVAPPQPPRPTTHVRAMRPERDALEIEFPRVDGYRVEPPDEKLTATFTDDSVLELTPEIVGPTQTQNAGIIGEKADLDVQHLDDVRPSSLLFHLTNRLMNTKWRTPGEAPPLHLFGKLKRIARRWVDECLECSGGTFPAQLMIQELADIACERITSAITRAHADDAPIKALLDPYKASGSTRFVNFTTTKTNRWETDPRKCHVNWAILDSDWEGEFCRVVEAHPRVRSYVKNHGLGLDVPYLMAGQKRRYRPDFIVQIDPEPGSNGHAEPLNLIVEIKGYRGEDAKAKKETMETKWVPGVNNNGQFGRWAFAEFTEVFRMEEEFEAAVAEQFDELITESAAQTTS